MVTPKSSLVVKVLTCCLTICQFVGWNSEAQTGAPGARSTKIRGSKTKLAANKTTSVSEQVVATAAVRADEEDLNFATAERSDMGSHRAPRTWLTADQSIFAPVPLNGMVLTAATLSGSIIKANASAPGGTSGVNFNTAGSATSLGPSLQLSYGLSDNFYIMSSASYSPSKSEAQITGASSQFNSTSRSEGWDEPTIGVGASGRVGRTSRITAELSGDIPVGNGRSEINETATSTSAISNGLSGGGSISPSLTGMANLGSVKLLGIFSYRHYFERTTDIIRNGRLSSKVDTGGNSFTTSAIVEFPRALNLGIGVVYSRIESSSTTKYNSDAFVSGPQISTVPAEQRAGAVMYMGIPISDTNIVLAPSVNYLTALDRNLENNLSINQYDVWSFNFRGLVHF
jgi:hypothetical protein